MIYREIHGARQAADLVSTMVNFDSFRKAGAIRNYHVGTQDNVDELT